MHAVIVALLWGILGAASASLVQAASFTLPRRLPVVHMLRALRDCPRCGHRRSGRELVPIYGSLYTLGRGTEPRRETAYRLLVEMALAACFAWLAWWQGLGWPAVVLSVYACVFALVAGIDLQHRLILNAVLVPASVFALAVAPTLPDMGLIRAVVGAMTGFLLFLLAALVMPGGLGAGDVKLAGFLGLAIGFPTVLSALAMGILLGGVATIALLATRRIGRRDFVPYGPFLIAGAALVLFR